MVEIALIHVNNALVSIHIWSCCTKFHAFLCMFHCTSLKIMKFVCIHKLTERVCVENYKSSIYYSLKSMSL